MKRILLIGIVIGICLVLIPMGIFLQVKVLKHLPNKESSYWVLIAEIDKQGNMAYTDTWLVRYQEQEPKPVMVISY